MSAGELWLLSPFKIKPHEVTSTRGKGALDHRPVLKKSTPGERRVIY